MFYIFDVTQWLFVKKLMPSILTVLSIGKVSILIIYGFNLCATIKSPVGFVPEKSRSKLSSWRVHLIYYLSELIALSVNVRYIFKMLSNLSQ